MWKEAVIAKLRHMGGETGHGAVRIGVLIMEQGIWTFVLKVLSSADSCFEASCSNKYFV
jgi:hypothetical protein